MKITYDPEVDVLYIQFQEATVTTKHLDDDVAIDYDADGIIAGIEILNVRQRLKNPNLFRTVTLEEMAFAHAVSPYGQTD